MIEQWPLHLKYSSSSMILSLLWWSCWVNYWVFISYGLAWSTTSGSVSMLHLIMRLSMEHHERISINAPTHSEACFCFELGLSLHSQRDLIMIGIRTQGLIVASPTLYHSIFLFVVWSGLSTGCVVPLRWDWAIFHQTGSGWVDRVWPVREKSLEKLRDGEKLNQDHGEDRQWDRFHSSTELVYYPSLK